MCELIFGASIAALSVARARLQAGVDKIHFVSPWLPDGRLAAGCEEFKPALVNAAGIQQPFGGGDPGDPRLRLYAESHPEMMRLAADPHCKAVERVEIKIILPPNAPLPPWQHLAENYRRENGLEMYTTAAFDPPGLVRYLWEEMHREFPGRVTSELRLPTAEECEHVRNYKPLKGYDRVHLCMGYKGFQHTFNDGTDFPILGVGVHFAGDGTSTCWMDERTPLGTSGQLDEPDILYVVRRPTYLGNGLTKPGGRIFAGGTYKPKVPGVTAEQLARIVDAIVAGTNREFGERFRKEDILDVTSGQRPGNENGFQIGCSDDGYYTWIRGQAGMGIVMAYGCGQEINRLLAA